MEVPSTKPAVITEAKLSADEVLIRTNAALFGRPLVVNVWRAVLVESLIDLILPPDWRWCATDYAGWDFQHVDGTRLEVKQSAARQSWTSVGCSSGARFDIAARSGMWDGAIWTPAASPMRHAHLYVLAYHPVTDDTADHRDPHQWVFYVVPTYHLPATRSIALQAVQRLVTPTASSQLAEVVETIRGSLASHRDIHRPVGRVSRAVSGPELARG